LDVHMQKVSLHEYLRPCTTINQNVNVKLLNF